MDTATSQRKRANFMINVPLLEQMETLIPTGERSDFVNEALEEKMIDLSRTKALARMEESIKKQKKVHTTKEILKILHADRRY